MHRPIAFKLRPTDAAQVYRVGSEPIDIATLSSACNGPAIVVARKASILDELTTGLVDASEIVCAQEGDWNNALLIVVGDAFDVQESTNVQVRTSAKSGDDAFMSALSNTAPHLAQLGRQIITLVRSQGVTGELVEKTKGRWVNSPLNSFTLKAQPRAGNIQFTLYGEPDSYNAGEFLRKDQNSYSRGWVKDASDAKTLASLVRQAHARRER